MGAEARQAEAVIAGAWVPVRLGVRRAGLAGGVILG